MENPEYTLSETLNNLLTIGVGDIARLNHIKKSLDEKKVIYNSDLQYVRELEEKYLKKEEQVAEKKVEEKRVRCWNCSKENLPDSTYCGFCGIILESKYAKRSFFGGIDRNLLNAFSGIHLYQILAVLGGLAVLVPVMYGISNIDGILDSLDFYTGYDLSNYSSLIVASGVLAGVISAFDMVIPFIWRKPKTVGKILFFSSFPVLVFSLVTGIVGFIMILVSGILAIKKRRY